VDLKTLASVEIEKNDRKYVFLMPIGSPFGEAYDAAFEVLTKIRELSGEALEKARRDAEDSEKSEKVAEEKPA